MQIVEVSAFGVRSAVITLRRKGSALRFVLYPMLHMASEGFYREIRRRLKSADLIVVEGVGGQGSGGKGALLFFALTFSYRVLKFNRRAGLVEQDIDYSAYKVPIVHPDVSTAEFSDGWKGVPLKFRLMLWLVLPVVVIGRLFGGSRWIWSRAMEETDLPEDERPEEVEEVFLGERDRRLLDALYEVHEKRNGESLEVAVVYGAGHVTAIVRGLLERYGYRPRSAEWVTVVDL